MVAPSHNFCLSLRGVFLYSKYQTMPYARALHAEYTRFKASWDIQDVEMEFEDVTEVPWAGYAIASRLTDWEESRLSELNDFLGMPAEKLMH